MILNEDLQQCTQKSLIIACTKAAEAGLVPDGEESALVAYNVKVSKKNEPDRWEKQAKFLPMVAGIRKQVRQSGVCKDWKVRIVRESDHFEHLDGDIESIVHRPSYDDDSPITHVYSIAYLESGELSRHVMSAKSINKIRSKSRSADRGPWADWYPEMAKKTCLKQHAKALPRAKEDKANQRFMGALHAIDDAEGVIDTGPTRLSAPPVGMQEASRQRLVEAAETMAFDSETGEEYEGLVAPKATRRPRKTANEKLAEAEGRASPPPAQQAAQATTDGNGHQHPLDEGRDLEFESKAREAAAYEEPEDHSAKEEAYRNGWLARGKGATRMPPRDLRGQELIAAFFAGWDNYDQAVKIGNAPRDAAASEAMLDQMVGRVFA